MSWFIDYISWYCKLISEILLSCNKHMSYIELHELLANKRVVKTIFKSFNPICRCVQLAKKLFENANKQSQ